MQLKALVIAHGAPENLARSKALLLLNAQVGRQAAMLSFEHLFLLYGVTLLGALSLLLLMHQTHLQRAGALTH